MPANYYKEENIFSEYNRVTSSKSPLAQGVNNLVYFVSQGEVEIFVNYESENGKKTDHKQLMVVKEGELFGEVEYFNNYESRIVNARPITEECKVFILDNRTAEDIFLRFENQERDAFAT